MPALEVRKLTKFYRRVPVVNDVSFTVRSGEVTGYLGPNGSGKSTTVKMLAGLVEPSSGEILLDGIDVRRDLIGFKRRLGYVPEEAYVYQILTGMEYLQLVGRLRDLPDHAVNKKATELPKLFSLYSTACNPQHPGPHDVLFPDAGPSCRINSHG
jgi:ABC-2 type transport system ATP-binding protein